jgi:hypothetical protein
MCDRAIRGFVMDLRRLTTLKQKLIEAKNFSEILGFFLDEFGNDPDFISLGQRVADPFLEAVVTQVGQELFGQTTKPSNLLLTRLPEYSFIHGACHFHGRLANVIYFEDIHSGLMAIVPPAGSNETKVIRFSGRPLTPPRRGEPSLN